jgi:hypothetical protein
MNSGDSKLILMQKRPRISVVLRQTTACPWKLSDPLRARFTEFRVSVLILFPGYAAQEDTHARLAEFTAIAANLTINQSPAV